MRTVFENQNNMQKKSKLEFPELLVRDYSIYLPIHPKTLDIIRQPIETHYNRFLYHYYIIIYNCKCIEHIEFVIYQDKIKINGTALFEEMPQFDYELSDKNSKFVNTFDINKGLLPWTNMRSIGFSKYAFELSLQFKNPLIKPQWLFIEQLMNTVDNTSRINKYPSSGIWPLGNKTSDYRYVAFLKNNIVFKPQK